MGFFVCFIHIHWFIRFTFILFTHRVSYFFWNLGEIVIVIDELLRIFSYFLIIVLIEYIYRTYIYIISFWRCVFKYLTGTRGEGWGWRCLKFEFSSICRASIKIVCLHCSLFRSLCLSVSVCIGCVEIFMYTYIYIYLRVHIYSYWLIGKKRLFRNCIHRFINKYFFGGACFESRCESYFCSLSPTSSFALSLYLYSLCVSGQTCTDWHMNIVWVHVWITRQSWIWQIKYWLLECSVWRRWPTKCLHIFEFVFVFCILYSVFVWVYSYLYSYSYSYW